MVHERGSHLGIFSHPQTIDLDKSAMGNCYRKESLDPPLLKFLHWTCQPKSVWLQLSIARSLTDSVEEMDFLKAASGFCWLGGQ